MCFVSQIFPSYPRTSTVRSVRYPSVYYLIKTLLCTNPEEFNPKNKIYLFFRERQEDSVLPSMGNNRIRFPEFLLDLASGTPYFPFKLPSISLRYKRMKILTSYVPTTPTQLAILYFLASSTKLFYITSQASAGSKEAKPNQETHFHEESSIKTQQIWKFPTTQHVATSPFAHKFQ